MRGKLNKGNKRGVIWQELIPWIIALGVLVLIVIIYGIISGKGEAAIAWVENLVRFRGV